MTLLEAHKDFNREFRGNTSKPSVMEIMEELGLVDCLLGLHHTKEWKQHSLFSVESDRLRRWYHPGLLLIGDAAHVVSLVARSASILRCRRPSWRRAYSAIHSNPDSWGFRI